MDVTAGLAVAGLVFGGVLVILAYAGGVGYLEAKVMDRNSDLAGLLTVFALIAIPFLIATFFIGAYAGFA